MKAVRVLEYGGHGIRRSNRRRRSHARDPGANQYPVNHVILFKAFRNRNDRYYRRSALDTWSSFSVVVERLSVDVAAYAPGDACSVPPVAWARTRSNPWLQGGAAVIARNLQPLV